MTVYALGDLRPQLPESGDYWIAPDANVIGRVVLGEGVGIWFGSTLRGDNEPLLIGEGTNIQENCVLHTDMGSPLTIGANCTIGHTAMLHGCTIGDETLIGMGATVLNNVRIGRNCIIGAGALITEGKEIPDRSLVVGAPGRVVRELDDATVAGLLRSAQGYRENMRRFRAGMRAIED